MSAVVTQWFAINQPPVWAGIYQYKYEWCGDTFAAYWNGRDFIINDASDYHGMPVNINQGDQWRGLAVKP